MKGIITQSRDVSAIVPLSVSSGIKPVCVPFEADDSFSAEVGGRFSARVYDLWKRLNLDFLEDSIPEENASQAPVTVNNFSQQILFQLFATSSINKLIKRSQPTSVIYRNLTASPRGTDRRSNDVVREVLSELSERQSIISSTNSLAEKLTSETHKESVVEPRYLITAINTILRSVTEEKQVSEQNNLLLQRITERCEKQLDALKVTEQLKQLTTVKETERISDIVNSITEVTSALNVNSYNNELITKSVEKTLELIRSGGSSAEITKTITELVKSAPAQSRDGRDTAYITRVLKLVETAAQTTHIAEVNAHSTENVQNNIFNQLNTVYSSKSSTEIRNILRNVLTGSDSLPATMTEQTLTNEQIIRSASEVVKLISAPSFAGRAAAFPQQTAAQSGSIAPLAGDMTVLSGGDITAGNYNYLSSTTNNNYIFGGYGELPPVKLDMAESTAESEANITAPAGEMSSSDRAVMRVELMRSAERAVNSIGARITNYISSERYIRSRASEGGAGAAHQSTTAAAQNVAQSLSRYNVSQYHEADRNFSIVNHSVFSPVNRTDATYHNTTTKTTAYGGAADITGASEASTVINENLLYQAMKNSMSSTVGNYYTDNENISVRYGDIYDNYGADTYHFNTQNNSSVSVEGDTEYKGDTVIEAKEGQVLSPTVNMYQHLNTERYFTEQPAQQVQQSTEVRPSSETEGQQGGNVIISPNVTVNNIISAVPADVKGQKITIEKLIRGGTLTERLLTERITEKIGRVLPPEIRTSLSFSAGDVFIRGGDTFIDRNVYSELHFSQNIAADRVQSAERPVLQRERGIMPTALAVHSDADGGSDNVGGLIYDNNSVRRGRFTSAVLSSRMSIYGGDNYFIRNSFAEGDSSVSNIRVLSTDVNTSQQNYSENYFIQSDEQERAVSKGRMLPPSAGSYRSSARLVMPEKEAAQTVPADEEKLRQIETQKKNSSSFRDRLDEKTLAALDSALAAAASVKSVTATAKKGSTTVIHTEWDTKDVPSEIVYKHEQPANTGIAVAGTLRSSLGESIDTLRIMHEHLTAASKTKRTIATTISRPAHIEYLIEHAGEETKLPAIADTRKYLAMNSAVSYKVNDAAEEMIMLVPPVEMDKFQMHSGYKRDLPPIEYHQKQQPKSAEPAPVKPTLNEKMEQSRVTKTVVTKGIDDLSREDIEQLADKIYSQIENRIINERRRSGF